MKVEKKVYVYIAVYEGGKRTFWCLPLADLKSEPYHNNKYFRYKGQLLHNELYLSENDVWKCWDKEYVKSYKLEDILKMEVLDIEYDTE